MEKITTTFLNLQTDFAFKLIFGSEKNKKILIRFLNALFEGQLHVTDVTYHDKEVLPSSKDGKTIIYDVFCHSLQNKKNSPFYPLSQVDGADEKLDVEHHFILEMQNIYIPPFEERLVYYMCRAVTEQGKKGWDYELQPVLTIAITDFNFSYLTPKLIRDVMLVDKDSGEAFTNKLHVFLCSLKEVPSRWEDCKTELEEMLFLIKNMDKMNTTSLAYTEGKYSEIFDATRSNTLKEDEIVRYKESLDYLNDVQRGIRHAEKQYYKKGKLETAKNLLAEGMDINVIARATGLSISELEQLI